MKKVQNSVLEEHNGTKRQYEQPHIEVVELDKQTPLLAASLRGTTSAGSIEEEDW
ncbi:MAG: hypothetical protein J6T60_14975 [Bacteroidales bacterium]|nr:hypothetical protein [Bacteroidales bacterium]